MQIILASAKIMNDRVKSIPDISLSTPRFQNEAEGFARDMVQYSAESIAEMLGAEGFARDMVQYSAESIAEMLGCSQQIAAQNRLRYMRFFEDSAKLPAILAYHGQAYKHLKAETLTVDDLNVAHGKLWITSFLYGLLRPLDAILPYRMEGHVELPSGEGQNMFAFWKSRLTDILIDAVKADDGVLIHLATEEYQHSFDWQRVRKEVKG